MACFTSCVRVYVVQVIPLSQGKLSMNGRQIVRAATCEQACTTQITSQLPLFATYLVFTVHNIIPHYMFRLYGHLQVCYMYKNAKIILKLNGSVNLVSKWTTIQVCIHKKAIDLWFSLNTGATGCTKPRLRPVQFYIHTYLWRFKLVKLLPGFVLGRFIFST
jgi:hypothetical protein